jgi:hypothetical protein
MLSKKNESIFFFFLCVTVASVEPCANLGVHCCDLVAQYTATSETRRTLGKANTLDIGCKHIDAHGSDVSVSVTARPLTDIVYNANNNLGAIFEDADGNRGVGVSASPFEGALVNDAGLLDAAEEGFDIKFNQFVRIHNLRLAAFTRRRAIDVAEFQVNSVHISCSREGGKIFQKDGVRAKTVSGDLDGIDVNLDEFGIVNACTVRYSSGPGFAVSSIAWQPYALINHDTEAIRKFIQEELLKEVHPKHDSSSSD